MKPDTHRDRYDFLPKADDRTITDAEVDADGDLDARLATAETRIAAQNEELEQLRIANADLEVMSAAVDYRFRRYEGEIAKRDRLLAERDEIIAERERQLAQGDAPPIEADRLLEADRARPAEQSRAIQVPTSVPVSSLNSDVLRSRQGMTFLAFAVTLMSLPIWLGIYRPPESVRLVAASVLPLIGAGITADADAVGAQEDSQQDGAGSADGLARKAEQLFEQGDLAGAVKSAEEATRLAPDSARHHRLLGYIHAALGAEHEATEHLSRAAQLEPSMRVSLADYYLARAWVDLEEEARRRPDDSSLADRLRGLAAVAELNPELRAMSRVAAPNLPLPAVEFVPPLMLTDAGNSALVVEKRSQIARLYRYQNGHLVVAATYPVTTGQALGTKQRRGDLRTPDGVYAITDLLPGEELPGRYGALAMPLSYPNAWDRTQKLGGDGIWIHGADSLTAPFNPRGTKGCVTMRAADLRELARTIDPAKSPVLIAEEIPYVAQREWNDTITRLFQHAKIYNLLNVVASPNYIMVAHREGDSIVRDYFQPREPFASITKETTPWITTEAWDAKLTRVNPGTTAALLGVQIENEGGDSVVIETTAPADVKEFSDESSDHLYLDLVGVRPGVIPTSVAGHGRWVKQVRIAATDVDPPITRLVIEMLQPSKHQISRDGNRTVISFAKG